MSTEFVELGVFFTQLDAEIVRGLLTENGIESRISKDDCGGMMPNLQFSEGVRVQVELTNLREAQEIILNHNMSPQGDNSEFQATGWTCSNCNEVLEGQFTDCWKCGTSRI